MRPLFFALVGLIPLIAAPNASAAQCDRNDESQTGMNICADADYKAADAKLNQTYGRIIKRLSGDRDTTKLLQASQRAWIAFRDAECSFQTSASREGSIHPMEVAICLRNLTEERTKALDAYLHCSEGDPSCPVPAQ